MSGSSTTEVITVNAQAAMAKIGTAAGGTAWGLSSLPLNEIAAFLTCVLVLGQIILLVPKYMQMYRAWRSGRTIEVEVK